MLRSNSNFTDNLESLILKAEHDIIIFSPYIKFRALSSLLKNHNSRVPITIITTWKPHDIAFGASDISIYQLCKGKNFNLLINNKIHLKSILTDNMTNAYVGSANITGKGLGYSPTYNFELGLITSEITIEDKIYFDRIIESSRCVDDEYYRMIQEQCKNLDKPTIEDNFKEPKLNNSNFLITSLPMCDNVENFYSIYSEEDRDSLSEVEIRSEYHDRRLFDIKKKLNKHEFYKQLKISFNDNLFIKTYKEFIGNDEKRFGEITHWLHNIITNVPTPRRSEIKECLVRVNKFLLELDDNYSSRIPGKRSQVFYRRQK
jgi:hypothetical protein